MRLCGTEVTTTDCWLIIDALRRVGRAIDLELAYRIERGIELETRILALSQADRKVLLAALVEPPESLSALRGGLARDLRHST